MTSGESSNPGRTAKTLQRWLVTLLAVAATVAGLVILNAPREIGWVAYAPLSNTSFASSGPELVVVDGTSLSGVALVGAGLLALAFWAGFRVGRQRIARA